MWAEEDIKKILRDIRKHRICKVRIEGIMDRIERDDKEGNTGERNNKKEKRNRG